MAIILLVGMIAWVSAAPKIQSDSQYSEYAVMYKIGTSQNDIVKQIVSAGGKPLRSGNFDFIAIAVSEDPDFKQAMYEQGAMLVFSPVIKGGCITENSAVFKS